MRGLTLAVASGGHSSSRCAGLSLSRPLLLRSTGSRRAGSVIVAHGLSCSAACEIFPDQGSNPCLLHWQADSQPLRHQGSPSYWFWSPEVWWSFQMEGAWVPEWLQETNLSCSSINLTGLQCEQETPLSCPELRFCSCLLQQSEYSYLITPKETAYWGRNI